MIAFTAALGLDEIDLLGFSIGGMVAQEIALVRPTTPRCSARRGSRATLVIQGDEELMIPTKLSHLMAGLIPDAQIRIYPDAAHGFLFQYPVEVAADVNPFLVKEEGRAGS